MIANLEIKQKLIEYNIHYYQLAKELQITETSLSRKLRYELDNNEKEIILELIENIKDNKPSEETLKNYKTYRKEKRVNVAKHIVKHRATYTNNDIFNKLEEIEQILIRLAKEN